MISITNEAERNRADVALERWRADLLDYDAALFDTIGKTRDADIKRQDAAHRRTIADLTAALQDAADAAKYHVKGEKRKVKGEQDPAVVAAYAALDAARVAYRLFKEANGLGGIVAVNDGLTEPTLDELGV